MAGYSKRPLVKKLGIQEGFRVALLQAPKAYAATLGKLPQRVTVRKTLSGQFDLIQFFTSQRAELIREFLLLKQHLSQAGALWISWPKKSSGVASDLTEDLVRAVGLEAGLVDVKVCAVDEIWSGLKFVRRLKDRI